MAYDPAHDVIVLFGGFTGEGGSQYLGDTWEWEGDGWALKASEGPSPRARHTMAYDKVSGRVILFGGYFYDGAHHYYDDTWSWDGQTWTKVNVKGPSPSTRGWHALCADEARNVVVLFGGDDNGAYRGDTWAWNGSDWNMVSNGGPGPLRGHAMCFDAARQTIVLTGGVGGDPRNTWEWDGTIWSIRSTNTPFRRYHAMTYDPRRRRAVLFGGVDAGIWHNSTWESACRPLLGIDATCPGGGAVTVAWAGATPNEDVALIFARFLGNFTVPLNRPCGGVVLELDASGIRVAARAISEPDGSGLIEANVVGAACGGYLQLLDIHTCVTSEPIIID